MTVVAYLLMMIVPRNKQAPIVTLWVIGYLCFSHLERYFYHFGSYEMDYTSYTMLLVCKLSSLAYCYQDGAKPAEKLTKDQQ